MSDWENDDEDYSSVPKVEIPVVAPSKWDDEDADDQGVKDSWDASEDEEDNSPSTTSPSTQSPKVKKKKTLAQKIAERKAAEEEKKNQKMKNAGDDEDPIARRARLQKEVEEADFENTKDLFGGMSVSESNGDGVLDSMKPSARADFDKFCQALSTKIATFESSPHYSYFIESLVRNITVALSVDETRKLNSALAAMINEKQKASATGKKKKKAGAKLVTKANNNDFIEDPDIYAGEYDDFM